MIDHYISLFSAEFAQLLLDPARFADRIDAIQKNDLVAEKDRDRLATFDRQVIAGITKKYDELLSSARAQAPAVT